MLKNFIRHIENRFRRIIYFCFLNAVWALASSGFRIVFKILVKPQLAIARLRLHASMMSICLSVAKMQKTRFSQKLSNLELWMVSIDDLYEVM